jgi:hypothetical protein
MLLGALDLENDDAVWLRQPDQPSHSPEVSAAKKLGDYPAFFDALAYMLEPLPVWCINTYSASCRVRNKGAQLRLAGASGLKVPATLMSNSPTAVREFFDQYPNNAICKAFASHVWQQQGSEDISVTETFCLTREQLPADDEVFTYAPAIYQEMVAKEFDVRLILMGERIYSYALRTPENSLDWRFDAARKNLAVEIISTPPEVEAGLHLFAQKTGICFGVMPWIGTGNGGSWRSMNRASSCGWTSSPWTAAFCRNFAPFLLREKIRGSPWKNGKTFSHRLLNMGDLTRMRKP